MAINYTCDGCNEVVKEHVERGYLRKKHYCKCCIDKVDDLLRKEMAERSKASMAARESIADIRSKFKSENPDVALPDEN